MPRQPDPDFGPADEKRLYFEGLRLFNDGQFFEAHEVWEDVWHETHGRRRLFYQGLIQAAVTLEHLRRGNRRGCLTVYKTCVSKFDDIPPVYMGLDILPLLQKLRAAIAHVLDDPKADVVPRKEALFAIELQYDPFESPQPPDMG